MRLFQRLLFVIMVFIFSSCTATNVSDENPPSPTSQPPMDVFLPTKTPHPTKATSLTTTGIPLPPEGYLYHGVFPAADPAHGVDVTLSDLISYEETVGKDAAWVYFSNEWFNDKDFPTETAEWIREEGSIPYIRLMMRSSQKYEDDDGMYSLQRIINGLFDDDIHEWCRDARSFGTQLIVEYGTEVNSDSFVWSGIHNGGKTTGAYGDPSFPDGPERFVDAYRHIIQICRDEGAGNITWVFHMDNTSHPEENWNRAENYYPGDEWIDWIGLSIYGVSKPDSTYFEIFSLRLDAVYPQITEFAPDKPIIIAEFGTAKNNPVLDQTQWTKDAFSSLDTERYPNLIGFSWWNEWWQNDRHAENDTTMRVEDSPELEELFREFVGNNPNVLGTIVQ